MRSKLLCLILGLVFVLGLMTACGETSITDGKSLIEANKAAQEKVESFHMDSDIDMDMSMKMDGLEAVLGSSSIEMPMKMEIAMDAGKETAHGTTTADISVLGQSQKVDAEMYYDLKNGTVYSKTADSSTWTKSEQDMSSIDLAGNLADISDEILEKAEFSSDDDGYKLTLQAKDLGDSINEMGLLNDINSAGVSLDKFTINEGQIIYTFNKENVNLQKVDMEDIKIDAAGTAQGSTVDLAIDMDGDYEFSKYNQLDPKDYEIPDEVTGGSSDTATTEATEADTKATEAPSGDLPKATTQLTVSGGSTPNNQGWYVVGQDSIPAGSYKIFHGDGQGVLKIMNADHSKTMGDWTIGYNDQSKELADGTQVDLVSGDLVFITEDLNVVFDPVN